MHFDLTKFPQLPSLHCRACGRRMFDGVFHGLCYMICQRCKEPNVILDGVVLKLGPRSPKPEKVAEVEVDQDLMEIADSPCLPDSEQMAEWIKDRCIALDTLRKWQRAEVAVGLRFKVFQRDGFRCRYCGRTPSESTTLEVDHVIPRVNGGPDSEENLVTACWDCNRGKSDKVLVAQVGEA